MPVYRFHSLKLNSLLNQETEIAYFHPRCFISKYIIPIFISMYHSKSNDILRDIPINALNEEIRFGRN